MRSSISMEIAAPPRLVFDLARDVERWPALLPHYLRVDILDRDGTAVTARMIALRAIGPMPWLGIPVVWQSRAWADPAELQLRFVHQGGATGGMDVTWRIEQDGDGCKVTIEHDFEPIFVPWATFVDRWFVRPIAGRTLRTFKAIAEAVVAATSETPRSGEAPPANTRT